MEEKEVLYRLGFEEEEKLSAVEQLKDYELRYAGGEKNFEDYFWLTDKKNIKDLMNAYLKVLSTEQPILPIFYYGRIVGWRAYLNPDLSDQEKSTLKRYEPPYIKMNKDDVQSDSTDELVYVRQSSKDKRKFTSLSTNIQRGHILPELVNSFFSFEKFLKRAAYSNVVNTIPQFKRANENSKNSTGQAYFENIIKDHRDTHFFYESEAIFAHHTDKVPIGTRIRIVEIEKQNENLDFIKNSELSQHVFIPNCDYLGEERYNTIDDYRSFFKEGNMSYLSWRRLP